MAEVVELLTTIQEGRGSSPGRGKFSDGICKYLPHLSIIICYIMCLIVVSVCIN